MLHEPLLAVKGIKKSYRKKSLRIPVLKGVNLEVRQGEFVAVVGQSGSGKSTLLHILGTLDVPDEGEMILNGERIDKAAAVRRDWLRNYRLGFIFQFYHLLPELTAMENVLSPLMIRSGLLEYCFYRSSFRRKAAALLEQVGLSHRLKHKPNELSGGEMQRTAIARALMTEPQLLLADEPTGNLDAASAKEIIQLLRQLCNQHRLSIVMVTHDNSIAAVADRIVQMVDGQICR
ncbi:MAG: ABC transporter ATP-binding protein [Planctomycetaceae bacterium]|jgi:lipoprotein-releasing system ATP-binding protein|nr:ABC transporter ATP-binding protein [Planctomycetaceae bacterium]